MDGILTTYIVTQPYLTASTDFTSVTPLQDSLSILKFSWGLIQ